MPARLRLPRLTRARRLPQYPGWERFRNPASTDWLDLPWQRSPFRRFSDSNEPAISGVASTSSSLPMRNEVSSPEGWEEASLMTRPKSTPSLALVNSIAVTARTCAPFPFNEVGQWSAPIRRRPLCVRYARRP